MELSIREAAALVGRSTRAIRQWIASKRLAARKHGRSWLVRLEHLPLTEQQRQKALARAEQARELVDQSLPSRLANSRDRRRRSLLDLDAYRVGCSIVRALESEAAALLAQHTVRSAARLSRQAVLQLAEGVHEFDHDRKTARLNRARRNLARCVALLLAGEPEPPPAIRNAVEQIEQELMPLLGGLLRWSRRPFRNRAG